MNKVFPILKTCGERHFQVLKNWPIRSVPWEVAEKFRDQAMRNHGQTIERLAERGGLSIEELWHVLHNQRWMIGAQKPEIPFDLEKAMDLMESFNTDGRQS